MYYFGNQKLNLILECTARTINDVVFLLMLPECTTQLLNAPAK